MTCEVEERWSRGDSPGCKAPELLIKELIKQEKTMSASKVAIMLSGGGGG